MSRAREVCNPLRRGPFMISWNVRSEKKARREKKEDKDRFNGKKREGAARNADGGKKNRT